MTFKKKHGKSEGMTMWLSARKSTPAGANSMWKCRKCLVCSRHGYGLSVLGAQWAKQGRVGDKARKMELGADHQSLVSHGK